LNSDSLVLRILFSKYTFKPFLGIVFVKFVFISRLSNIMRNLRPKEIIVIVSLSSLNKHIDGPLFNRFWVVHPLYLLWPSALHYPILFDIQPVLVTDSSVNALPSAHKNLRAIVCEFCVSRWHRKCLPWYFLSL